MNTAWNLFTPFWQKAIIVIAIFYSFPVVFSLLLSWAKLTHPEKIPGGNRA